LIKKQYQKLVAWYYDPFMKGLEKTLKKYRKELIKNAKGVVLEVGAGTGVNFDLYPSNVQVYAVEPSYPMYKRALKRAQKKSNIRVFNMGIENIHNHPALPSQFDTITSMLVLCTVADEQKVAKIYYEKLKKNGNLLVLEHIHSTGKLYGKIQKIINPLWKPLADGCHLTRRQDIVLKEAGFHPIYESFFTLGTDWYQAIMKK